MKRTAAAIAVGALAAAGLAQAATDAPGRPANGRHVAQLCVATSDAPPSCGPAQVDLRADGTASVRVDDIVYRLKLDSSQVEVVVMHNVVQIDEFTVPYEWAGRTLRFADDDRHSRYEVRFAQAKAR